MADQAAADPAHPEAGEIRAAGAVVWRPAAAGPEVALIHRPRYGDWTLPKGKALPGEHVLLTAVREVAEETGIRVVLGRRLATARYPVRGRPKRVDYWVGQAAGDAETAGFVPNDEVDALAWLPLTEAASRVSYPHDAGVLAEFAAGPAATVPVILLRHTWARRKETWLASHPDDLPRPLSRHGEIQARELAEILYCFGPARVLSSPAERCLASVRPYAATAGVKVESEPAFAVGDGAGAALPAAAQQRVFSLLAAGEPAVVCGHRENIPALLASACQALDARVPAGPPLPKAGFWVLHTAAGRLAGAEQHHLDAQHLPAAAG